MKLLLLSLNPAAIPSFLGPAIRTLTYIEDAASTMGDAPFVGAEREGLTQLGYELNRVVVNEVTCDRFRTILEASEAVYLSSGLADVLLAALRKDGKDRVLTEAAKHGLPLIGASAGSVVLGRNIDSGLLMDGPTEGVHLENSQALGLVDTVIVPHSDGKLPPYPPEKMARVRNILGTGTGVTYLNDDQALLIDERSCRVVISA